LPIPHYQIQESGPGHKKIYWATIEIDGQTFEGLGHKKNVAMKKAAVNALAKLTVAKTKV
jgi:dsRNA-specific ribonuclease